MVRAQLRWWAPLGTHLCFCWEVLIMSSADNDATCLPLGSINPASPGMLWCLLLLQLLQQGAQTDPWTTGSAAVWTPWDSKQESCPSISKNTELMHMNCKAYLVSRHIVSLIIPWHWLQGSASYSLNATSFWHQNTLWETQRWEWVHSSVLQEHRTQMKSGLCHSRQDMLVQKHCLASSTHCSSK